MAKQAYINGKKLIIAISQNEFTEEVVFYDNMVYCFISIKDYRILYNYLSPYELGINPELDSLSIEQCSKSHFLTGATVGNLSLFDNGTIKCCTVINTYESFLDFTNINLLPQARDSNIPLRITFEENLIFSKIYPPALTNHQYGTLSYNPFSLNKFTYIYFENIIIITSYTRNLSSCYF